MRHTLVLAFLLATSSFAQSPAPAPALPAVPLPFQPDEFHPQTPEERAALLECAERMAGVSKEGDTTPLPEQQVAAYRAYFTRFPTGKFRPVAVGAFAKMLRKANKLDAVLDAARDLVTKEATLPKAEVALMLTKHYVAGGGEPAKAVALMDEQAKSKDGVLAWRAVIGGAQLHAATDMAAAAKRIEDRGDKDLTPAQLVERDYWLGRILHELLLKEKDAERARLEDRVTRMFQNVAAACEKDPAANAHYAAAFIGLARLGLSRNDPALARDAYAKVAKLYPGTQEAQEAAMFGPQIELLGKPAPEFTGPDLDGKPVSSKILAGKIALIDFWATFCPPCLKAAPGIAKMAKDLEKRPFAIVSISLDEPEKRVAIEDFLKKTEITWPQIYEAAHWKSEIAAKYKVNALPAVFLLDETGKVIRVGLEGAELRAAVEAEVARLEKAQGK